jgi:hypothetical protein
MQAYAVRAGHYPRLLRVLRAKGQPGAELGTDIEFSRLADAIPMYAVYPNIAWQNEGYSDLMAVHRKTYREDGQQARFRELLRETNERMCQMVADGHAGDPAANGKQVFLTVEHAFRFLQTPDHAVPFESSYPRRCLISLDRRSDRRSRALRQFATQGLEVETIAATDGRLARRGFGPLSPGEYGCALSHLRILRAMARQSQDLVVFEDDVILHPRFRAIVEATAIPEDWGMLYFGCMHVEAPEPVGPGLVRVRRAYSTHAIAMRGSRLREILDRLRTRWVERQDRQPIDVMLADLQSSIPSYAFYPNLAWQGPGNSDITGSCKSAYSSTGCQRFHQYAIAEADKSMRAIAARVSPRQTLLAAEPAVAGRFS